MYSRSHTPRSRIKRILFPVVSLGLMLMAGTSWTGYAAPLAVDFSAQGLSSIKVGDREFLAKGLPLVSRVADANGKTLPGKQPSTQFDAATKTLTIRGESFRLVCTYEPKANELGLNVTVENTGSQTLGAMTINLLSLASLGDGKSPQPSFCVEEPAFTFFEGSEGSAVLAALNPKFPISLDLPKDTKTGLIPARVAFGGGRVIVDDVQMNEKLEPGEKFTFQFVLRVGPAGTDSMVLASDFLDAFRKELPSNLNWPDRRPILRVFFGGGVSKEEAVSNLKNPDAVRAPEPNPAFQQSVLKKVDSVLEAAKSVDAQAMILWDLEGGTFPHAITYIGDPRLIRLLNPQMDLLADSIAQKIRDAGLRVGVTLRPSRVIYDAEKNSARHSHTDAADPYTELEAKVEYAKKRWGCTVFYVDTNVFWRPYGPDKKFQSAPLTADLWRRLREKHPDTLFIPEFASTGDYASTAGYGEADMGNYGVPPVARALYPDAFRVIVIEDADAAENYDRFLAAIEAGNSLMTFGQGRNHFNTLMIRRMQDDLSLRKSAVPPQVSAAGGDQLPDLLDSADKAVVFHTTMRLGETPAANAAPRLLTIVQNEEMDWPIRRAALVALGKTPYAPAVPVLFELLSDKQTGLYADASRALAGQDASVEELAVEAIRAAATRKGNAAECDQIGAVLVLRKASARALAIQEIFSTLPETDGPLRRSLVTLIGELRNPESEAFLLGLLDQPQLGPTAAAGLVRIGTPSAVAAVKSAQTAAQKGGNKELAGAYGRALQVK